MKSYYVIGLLLMISISASCQNINDKNLSVLECRLKADQVLKILDRPKTERILYSISNQYYHIIVKNNNDYEEYYIKTDSVGNVEKKNRIDPQKNSFRRHDISFEEMFTIKYKHDSCYTSIDHFTYYRPCHYSNSYFVMKDVNDIRHGEFFLPMLHIPPVIDERLYVYLLGSLVNEM